MPSAAFEKAFEEVKTLQKEPTNDEKLKLYGLNKIARGEEAKSAGTFDFAGKAKYNAWKKLKDDGTSPGQADSQYAAFVDELKTKYGTK